MEEKNTLSKCLSQNSEIQGQQEKENSKLTLKLHNLSEENSKMNEELTNAKSIHEKLKN